MRLACTLLLPLLKGSADKAEAKDKPAAWEARERAAAVQGDMLRAAPESAPAPDIPVPVITSSGTNAKTCLPTARLRLPAQCATMAPMRRRRRVRTG